MGIDKLKFESSPALPGNEILVGIVKCMEQFMRSSPVDRWQEKFRERDSIFIQWVKDGSDVVAFKAGYELRPGLFYSWLGGVLPSHRRLGIATRLLVEQHAYAKSIGCTEIRTISTNEHKGMMICNLQQGFDIIETKARSGETRIVMLKTL